MASASETAALRDTSSVATPETDDELAEFEARVEQIALRRLESGHFRQRPAAPERGWHRFFMCGPNPNPQRNLSLSLLYLLRISIELPICILFWDAPCDEPLRQYVTTVLLFDVVLWPMGLFYDPQQVWFPSTPGARWHRSYRSLSTIYWFWLMVGTVWTFRSSSCEPGLRAGAFALASIFLASTLIYCASFCSAVSIVFVSFGQALEEAQHARENLEQGARPEDLRLVKRMTYGEFCEHDQQTTEQATQCAITLEDFEDDSDVAFLPCGHIFMHGPALQWLESHSRCPLCQRPLDLGDEDGGVRDIEAGRLAETSSLRI